MDNNIFRKSSLERISSPEQLNEYIKITNPSVWGVVFGCMAILIALAFWSVFGSIPESIQSRGVIFPENGVTKVISQASGRATDVRVKTGDFVQSGQIIAVVPQDMILNQIKELKAQKNVNADMIAALMSEYERTSIIVAPVSGIVLDAIGSQEMVSANQAIANIVKSEKYSNDKQVICYIPTGTAKKLREGMEVQVSPDFASREEYGYMYGRIASIGSYSITEANILSTLGSSQYAVGIVPQDSSVEVRINLTLDPNSAEKIKWSNEKGESIRLDIGTKCNMLIIVNNMPPYKLVFN